MSFFFILKNQSINKNKMEDTTCTTTFTTVLHTTPTTKKKVPQKQQGQQRSLKNFGYNTKDTTRVRHEVLKKACKSLNPFDVYYLLGLLRVLQKTKNPEVSNTCRLDQLWLKRVHTCTLKL